MFARRQPAGLLVVAILCLAAVPQEAVASPARRLARRGVIVAPAPVPVFVPRPVPLFPPPFLAAPVPPGAPAVVIGPAGRVRRVLVMPPAPLLGPWATVTESAAAPVAQPPVAKAPAASSSAPQVAGGAAVASPAPLAVEEIPAPLPAAQPAPRGDVVPAGVELEIPDGTQSVLVPADGGQTPPAGR